MSLISAKQLDECLHKPSQSSLESPVKLVILFVSKDSQGPGVKPQIVKQNPSRYIPGSMFFDLDDRFSDPLSNIANTMITAHEFEKQAGALGINENTPLVIYDDFGNFYASRVWFMFKAMGHKHVHLLDGGLHTWLNLHLPTVDKLIPSSVQSIYKANVDAHYQFVDHPFILSILDDPAYKILDARSIKRFSGEEKETRGGLRSGHIPNSSSMHYATLQNHQGEFIAQADLSRAFEPYAKQQLVFTCGSGVTACILAQAADLIGVRTLKVYDGSWSQWGADNTLPIQTNMAD